MKSTDNTHVLARLRARAEGVMSDRASNLQAITPTPEEKPKSEPLKPAHELIPPPIASVEAPMPATLKQEELFHRSKRSNDGMVTRFTDDEIRDKRRDIAAAELELNMNISMSDHVRITHNYFKRCGAKITKEMVLEVWASDRRRHKRTLRQNDSMS